jgi:formylglycine-generating enzyme required for sulfatase activity
MSRLLALIVVAFFTSPVFAQQVPKPGEVRKFEIAKGVFMEFCDVPGGMALLGSPKDEKDRQADEKEHDYITKGFWLGKYTVTQAEWKAVMGSIPEQNIGKDEKKMDRSRFPVASVSWSDCKKFLKAVNDRPGAEKVFGFPGKFRLPQEDEWEYACRGGKGNKQPFFWGNELNGTQANCNGDFPYATDKKGPYLARSCAVDDPNCGKYEVHPWGLMHMHGNLWQWCENRYEQTEKHSLRGGSFYDRAQYCRAACRFSNEDSGLFYFGCRICFCPE